MRGESMKNWSKDIVLLLTLLMVVSVGLSIMHSVPARAQLNDNTIDTDNKSDDFYQAIARAQTLHTDIEPLPAPPTPLKMSLFQEKNDLGEDDLNIQRILLNSRSVEKIVERLSAYPIDQVLAYTHMILANIGTNFKPKDKEELIAALVTQYNDLRFFDFLLEFDALQKAAPFLFVAANAGYAGITDQLIQWLEQQEKKYKSNKSIYQYLNSMIIKSLEYALEQNNIEAFNHMLKQNIDLDKNTANALLWRAVNKQKNPVFVPLLIANGANVNYDHNGATLLVRAAQNNDPSMVRALLALGAKVNYIADVEVGSALQQVISKPKYLTIEMLLRGAGAKE